MSSEFRGLGEKEYLKVLGSQLFHDSGLFWRDDCIMVPVAPDLNLVYSIDRPERIYHRGKESWDMRCYGRWCAGLVANDVIACGTIPRGISFDVGVDDFDTQKLANWARGVVEVSNKYGMKYEGGNLSTGSGISGICWGLQSPDRILRRSGARNRGIVIATGVVGTGWAVRLYRDEKGDHFSRLGKFTRYQEEPWVNLEAFKRVWDLRAIQCSMDLTDGVIEFGYEIFEQSGLGVIFEPPLERPFPINFVSKELGLPIEAFVFEPGYDTPYAHGWCIDGEQLVDVLEILEQNQVAYTVLGKVTSDPRGVFLRKVGGVLTKLPRYWDDILKPRGDIERWRKEIVPLFNK